MFAAEQVIGVFADCFLPTGLVRVGERRKLRVEATGLQVVLQRACALRAHQRKCTLRARYLIQDRRQKVEEVPDLIGGAEGNRTPDLCSAIARTKRTASSKIVHYARFRSPHGSWLKSSNTLGRTPMHGLSGK